MWIGRRNLVFAGLGSLVGTAPWRAAAAATSSDGFPSFEQPAGASAAIVDDLGAHLEVKVPMKRVAVFNRYTAEFVRAVAGTDVIVGIGADAKDPGYWPNLRASLVGQGQNNPNYEALIALQPDAVFFPRNGEWSKARQVLAPFGIPVVVMTAWDVLKHEANIALLGMLFDKPDRARQLIDFQRRYRELLVTRTANAPRKRVYLEEVGAYKTVLKGSGWHDMIEAAGGQNIFGDVTTVGQSTARGNSQSFAVDPEEILVRRPDVIVKLQPAQYEPHTKAFAAEALNAIAARPGFAELGAVRNGQVYDISYYLAGACSKIVGALQLASWLYPQRLESVDPSEAMRVWLQDFQGVPDPGHYWESLQQVRQ